MIRLELRDNFQRKHELEKNLACCYKIFPLIIVRKIQESEQFIYSVISAKPPRLDGSKFWGNF